MTVAVDADTFFAAVNTTVCAVPGVRMTVDGDASTPAGRPPTTTLTVPLNPLMLLAVRVRFCDEPSPTETLLDPRLRLKSA